MASILRLSTIVTVLLLVSLSGCYNKKVRHLASDVSLIQVGSSTRNDVLTYLGEPDGMRELGENREEWVFLEEKPSELQRTPFVGGFFDGRGYDKVFLVLDNDIVQSCQFREHEDDELDWADDYSWQEKKE